jgi:hypothetical protein
VKRRRVHPTRMALALVLLGLAIVLGACATNNVTPQSVASVTIDQGGAVTLAVGGTLQLTATVDAKAGASEVVKWTSANDAIATVSAAGVVSGVAEGNAVITATSDFDGTKTDTITVTVVAAGTLDPNNIYVDDDAAAGGDGSQLHPFQTIAAGIAAVNAGGTVHVLAGTYPEELYLDKALTLAGAGRNSVTITVTGNAPAPASEAGVVVANVAGVTLSGLTIVAAAPGPTSWIMAAYNGVSNLTVQDVAIDDRTGTSGAHSQIGGLELYAVSTATVQNVAITSSTGPSDQRGLFIGGGSSNVAATNLTTSGHDGWAGVLLDPGNATMTNVTIQGSFAEVNKMQANMGGTGSIVGLAADQFHFVARNTSSAYGSGHYWFYKESESVALADALFNFEADGQHGGLSVVQRVDPSNEGQLLNAFVAGQIFGNAYGYPSETRSSNIQSAIDAASTNGTIDVRAGTYDGALTLDKAGLAITGAGGSSVLTAGTATVLTVKASDVSVTDVQLEGTTAPDYAVVVDNVTGFALTHSNLMPDLAIDNQGGNAVDATTNYWGPPTGEPGGDDVLGDNVDTSGWVGTAW